MPIYTTFTERERLYIQDMVNLCVEGLSQKIDIPFKINSQLIDQNNIRVTLDISLGNTTATNLVSSNYKPAEQVEFEAYCSRYGFKPTDYNKEFTAKGRRFKLVGFNTRSPKNACKIVCVENNMTYKCTADMVKRYIGD